jgi:hypothetical protein
MMFEYNEFLKKIGLNPGQVKLLRHDDRGVAAWRRGGENAFGCFSSFQRRRPDPYQGVELASHFIPAPNLPDGSLTALYVGTTRIVDRWDWDGQRMPQIVDEQIIAGEMGRQDIHAFDLEWLDAGRDCSERLLIDWGLGARAWFQWADRRPKAILEIRFQAQEPPFPGFSNFNSRISEISQFPQAWIAALEGVRGVYLLVTDQGDQYVGSATGVQGFMGRWRTYLANGHGGNVLLRGRGHRDYGVTILDIASPDMSAGDIVAREAFWKAKLGARAFGLNAN